MTPKRPADYGLVDLKDLARGVLPEGLRDDADTFHRILAWIREFLFRPHPDLGRRGPVCPFSEPAVKKSLVWMALYRGRQVDQAELRQLVLRYRDVFLELEPVNQDDSIYKTILILLPDLPVERAPDVIDPVQRDLKMEFVKEGVMVGEFHPLCEKAGLWNESFRPLRSPIPMLAIRFMVPSDFAFLAENEDFLKAYLDRYGNKVPPFLRPHVDAAMIRWNLPSGRAESPEP